MQEYKIYLEDGLKHPRYSWPETLLTYQLEIKAEMKELELFHLIDENNNEISFQLSNVHQSENKIIADISFLAAMSCHSRTVFRFTKAISKVRQKDREQMIGQLKDNEITISNQSIDLTVNKNLYVTYQDGYNIFSIKNKGGCIVGNVLINTKKEMETYSAVLTENGSIYADCNIDIRYSDGSSYKLKLRIIQGAEFIEMKEEVMGFEQSGDAILLIEWSGITPDKRYAGFREYENIDQYNIDGYMPFRLKPYANWISWWESKTAAFTDSQREKSIGVFVKDAGEWDYGQYALWGSPDENAIRFYYKSNKSSSDHLTWEYPLTDGCRTTGISIYDSNKDSTCEQKSYIDYLWFWYEYINLNKVKHWILRWDEDKNVYPKFFPEESIPLSGVDVWHYGVRRQPISPEFMEEVVYKLSHNMNRLFEAGAVSAREFFSWVFLFDMAAPKMTQKQFDNIKACYAFMAYAHMDENFMPINKMLAGHPNFLADARAVPALMASIFPEHPHAYLWINQFERAMALNLKYHVRPDVKAWESAGGRWTENLGCYNFAALLPMTRAGILVLKTFGENVLMYPNIEKWTKWMIDALTAPVDGQRTYPPQGAHSGQYIDPIKPASVMRLLAELLQHYSPLLAEYLLNICPEDAPAVEERRPNSDIYQYLYDRKLKKNKGTRPRLVSCKYTGYGYILRASVGDESEVSVHLQQIDEGPNYRWGRAGQGGCGVIYYNAAGKRYSYNTPEDVGDANMGDVQGCCNFGVLIGHEYKSIGRNDLTEPLYDFGFAQYARVNASEYSQPFYQSRSVILSGNDYIAVYDQVGDMRVRGRFAWFVKEGEVFPHISQLKPGAEAVFVGPGIPADKAAAQGNGKHESKGVVYDGNGDFLTIVTHRQLNCDYNTYTAKTEYGAEIKLQGRTDKIFQNGCYIRHKDEHCSFQGYVGIVSIYGDSKAEGALFKGRGIGVLGTEVSLLQDSEESSEAGLSISVENQKISGMVICSGPTRVRVTVPFKNNYRLFIDSVQRDISFDGEGIFTFDVEGGKHSWQWADGCPKPQAAEITGTVAGSNSVDIMWKEALGAEAYCLDVSKDGGKSWYEIFTGLKENFCRLSGFDNGSKLHIRVRGVNKEYCGDWSHEYPVYITDRVPEAVEGLKVWKWENKFKILWGWQLGVDRYRLYRRKKGETSLELVYEGPEHEFIDEINSQSGLYEYVASAVNNNGEGNKSLPRDTAPNGLAFWDPQPFEGFRRYSKSHEYGYPGFNPWKNDTRKELTYPEE